MCDMNIQDLRLRTLYVPGTPFLIVSAYYCPTEFLHLSLPGGNFGIDELVGRSVYQV